MYIIRFQEHTSSNGIQIYYAFLSGIESPGDLWCILRNGIVTMRVWVIATCQGRDPAPFLSLLYVFLIFIRPRAGETSGSSTICGLFPQDYTSLASSRKRWSEASKALIIENYICTQTLCSSPEHLSVWNRVLEERCTTAALSLRSSRSYAKVNVPHG